ncbi:phosphoribosylanthranilate isomerase [Bacillus inaquosorum]|uniref:N-(5'-phosphoribosyl)anthranilate isomerase n=1 Tax=Bacillus vallismortis TaxID=72361 RepID=A0ABY4Y0U2_BACVA|nr:MULTISPECIES: phosphoribosylanthranilate isomerase [Bacillus subtilis group]MDM5300821.1 phosphoribosylanthranilate isomerase [Bacillus subtilis]USP96229.1 phosphoribosylanthranilate isomerase [Bacillus vallismortis]
MLSVVKICGIKTMLEAEEAVAAGAQAVGFVFSEESKRYVTPHQAREIILKLPPFVSAVGVFVNENLTKVNEIVASCRLTFAQLHGEEPPEYCERVICPVIKTIKVRCEQDLHAFSCYKAHSFLLDSYVKGSQGGTGQTFNWELAKDVSSRQRVILAGGLTPNNITEALETVKPQGIDVSSGVETGGKKDFYKMRELIRQCRHYQNVRLGENASCCSQ